MIKPDMNSLQNPENVSQMKVVILAGGRGTRLGEETSNIPKPMVHIGEQPILWHIMKIYAAAGFHDFVILLGYKGEIIKDFFSQYMLRRSCFTINLATSEVEIHDRNSEPWKVTLLDTGLDSMTGYRIKQAQPFVGNSPFFLTYGDGVADVEFSQLLDFHQKNNAVLTLTAVRPEGRFGIVELEENQSVRGFVEKPDGDNMWCNGGFFVCNPEVFSYIDDSPSTIFERGPIEKVVEDGKMFAYKHTGFWRCMDTLRDKIELNELWQIGKANWKVW
jgi:glucose-1-phosphate cytidylyltransferase